MTVRLISLFKVVQISLLLVLSVQSHAQDVADFTGRWVAAAGTISSTIGLSSKCSSVEIEIIQTVDVIETKLYKATCDLFGSTWGPITQEIRNGKIYEDGEEVGTITKDTMITVSTSGTMQYAYNLKLIQSPSGQKQLMSYYGTRGGVGAIVTEAIHDLK